MWLRSMVMSIWGTIDPIYYVFTRLKRVGHNTAEGQVFRVRLTSYKGRVVSLSDGTRIQKNDVLLKIHLHNVVLLKQLLMIQNEVKRGRLLYQAVKQSLPELALFVKNHPRSFEIKGIVGITMLNRGCSGLGFEVVPISSYLYKLLKWVCQIPIYLLAVIHPMKNLKKHTPAYLFMSKNILFQKYN